MEAVGQLKKLEDEYKQKHEVRIRASFSHNFYLSQGKLKIKCLSEVSLSAAEQTEMIAYFLHPFRIIEINLVSVSK